MDEMFYRTSLLKLRSYLTHEAKGHSSFSFSDDEFESLMKYKPRKLEDFKKFKIKGFPYNGKRVKSFGLIICDIFSGKNFKSFVIKSDSKGEVKVQGQIEKSAAFL